MHQDLVFRSNENVSQPPDPEIARPIEEAATVSQADQNLKPSKYEWEMSGDQLFGCLIVLTLLIAVAVWFLDDVADRLERLQRRFKRWRKSLRAKPHRLAPAVDISAANHEFETKESANTEITAPFGFSPNLQRTLSAEAVESKAANEAPTIDLQPETDQRLQTLFDELEESETARQIAESELAKALEELGQLTLSNTRNEKEMETAYKEMLGKGDVIVDLESKIDSFETLANSNFEKLKLAESDLKLQIKQQQANESKVEKAQSAAQQLEQELSKQREILAAESELVQSLKQQLVEHAAELKNRDAVLEKAHASTAENAASLEASETRHQELVEEFTQFKLSEEQIQLDLAMAKEEGQTLVARAGQLEKEVKATQQELRSKAEIATGLKNENAQLKSDLENIAVQLAAAQSETNNLLGSQKGFEAKLIQESELHVKTKQKLDLASQKIAALQESVDSAKSETAQNAKLHEETVKQLKDSIEDAATTRATEFNRLSEVSNTKLSNIETDLLNARQEIARLETQAETLVGEHERNTNLESQIDTLINENEGLKTQVATKTKEVESTRVLKAENENELAELRTQLESAQKEFAEKLKQTIDSNSKALTTELEKRERQGLEVEELRVAIEAEKEQRLKATQDLDSNISRVAELETQLAAKVTDEADQKELAQQIVKYKARCRKAKTYIERALSQKTEMSDLATEYLSAARNLKRDLAAQLQINAGLKKEIERLSAIERGNHKMSEANQKRMAERMAKAYVLKMKAQFEQKLKKKNERLRKLEKRQAVKSSAT